MRVLGVSALPALLDALRRRGYTLVGPKVREGALVYDEIQGVEDLPRGWTEEQGPGRYRLRQDGGPALFRYTVGPTPWKRFLLPPRFLLWRARREGSGFRVEEEGTAPPRYALLGVRSCDLHALRVLDRVLLEGPYPDAEYRRRREGLFVVAVNCSVAGATCFCATMGTGPRPQTGYDLALTEVVEGGRHFFVVEVGSPRGEEVLREVPHRDAGPEEQALPARTAQETARRMGHLFDPRQVREALRSAWEHPHWERVAGRCLTCGNCTQVCPTCFCTTVEDTTDLTGTVAERWRRWDSCFTLEFSRLHAGSVRSSVRSRYRQWLTHKLSTWWDQFGTTGCVGCGRCITWCPVGIDIREEARALCLAPSEEV